MASGASRDAFDADDDDDDDGHRQCIVVDWIFRSICNVWASGIDFFAGTPGIWASWIEFFA
eukprot:9649164-Karenia_brevis.AAC.1